MNLKIRIFSWIRLLIYLSLFIIFMIIPTSYFTDKTFCHYHNITGYLCPTCGVTRAFSSLLHFNIKNAFSYHPVFTILIFPTFLFITIQDVFTIIKREIKRKKKNSFLESVFLGTII